MMKLDRAINILETHNKWRRGNIDDMDYTVKDLGIAIDLILAEVKKLNIQPVSVALPSEEQLLILEALASRFIYEGTDDYHIAYRGILRIIEEWDAMKKGNER